MGETETLQELDADIIDAFADAGFTDVGTYTPASGPAVSGIRLLIDRAIQSFGTDSQVYELVTTITIQRADVADPARGATITVAETGEVFVIDKVDPQDSSLSVCVVVPA